MTAFTMSPEAKRTQDANRNGFVGRSGQQARGALPSDRMKFDVQVQALKAYSVASQNGKTAVTAEDIAPYTDVSASTAGLNSSFFVDCGLLTRESKGRYRPAAAAIEFARHHDFDPEEAGGVLAESFARTWFYAAAKSTAETGPMDREDLLHTLAVQSGGIRDRTRNLESLIDWLRYARLITVEGNGTITVATVTRSEGSNVAGGPGGSQPGRPDRVTLPLDDGQASNDASVLSFSFEFSLTVDDLAHLTPEQITAVFEAVGKAMAVKGRLEETS